MSTTPTSTPAHAKRKRMSPLTTSASTSTHCLNSADKINSCHVIPHAISQQQQPTNIRGRAKNTTTTTTKATTSDDLFCEHHTPTSKPHPSPPLLHALSVPVLPPPPTTRQSLRQGQGSAPALQPIHIHGITTHIEQICKKEDMQPQWRRVDPWLCLMVADGHSGRECVDALQTHSSMIFDETMRFGPEKGMDICTRLCTTFKSGAMVVLARLNLDTRLLQISSKGDASCNVYWTTHGTTTATLYHQQPHHSPNEVMDIPGWATTSCATAKQEKTQEMNEKRITCANLINHRTGMYRSAPPTPDPDGKTFHWNPHVLAYSFYYPNGHCVATSSFVGHHGVACLSSNYSEVHLPNDGTFSIVMSSDGVSDVMSPKDIAFLNRTEQSDPADGNDKTTEPSLPMTAKEIVDTAKRRWFGEMTLLKSDSVGKSGSGDEGGGGSTATVSTFVYAPSPQHGDDISCLVVHCE